jgi:mRNA-degrading endonuclease YafQ of YafQ-DinJ toxin-antitoxin module
VPQGANIEVTYSQKFVKELKAALKEAEENKTKPIEELIRDLNLEGDLWK